MSKRLVVFAAAVLLTFVSWSGASAAPAPNPLASLEAAIFAPAAPAAPTVVDAPPIFPNPPVTGPQCCDSRHRCSTCGPEGYTCVVSSPGICGANGACVCNP